MIIYIMDNNNELDFIKIPLAIFKNLYETNIDINNENLQKKANDLINNFNCFISNYDAKSLWEKKKVIAAQKKNNKLNSINRIRPSVLLIDINDELKFKKEFTSFLNKLTDINKTIIYAKITNFIKLIDENKLNQLFDILINFIKNSSNNIYIDVLYLFPENYVDFHINNYCFSYINNKEWFPSNEYIIINKILYNNDNYDNYCKFIKFKKQSLSLLKALLIINKKLNINEFVNSLINEILISIDKYINNNNYKHITEFILDELILIIDNYNEIIIIDKLKSYNLDNLDNSTKFKIMKILNIK